MPETCVCCGAAIPEGRMTCLNCEATNFAPDAILQDGTPLYFKAPVSSGSGPLQMYLYDLLNRGRSND